MKRLLLICGIALVTAPLALAGRTPTVSPTVSVSPNPVLLNSPFSVSGCGYKASEELVVRFTGSINDSEYEFADVSGCFTRANWLWLSSERTPGAESVSVYDASNGKPKTIALAWASFSVV